MNIPIASTINNQCSQIAMQSNGDSKYVDDGYYELFLFGAYRFLSTDERGNNIYHANIRDHDWFIVKKISNNWVVRTSSLQIFKTSMANLHKVITTFINLYRLTLTVGNYLFLFIVLRIIAPPGPESFFD